MSNRLRIIEFSKRIFRLIRIFQIFEIKSKESKSDLVITKRE
jgi:hypothetical protein